MRSSFLTLVLAIVMGAIAAFLARDWLAAHAVTNVASPTATIVVATAPLGFGAQITADNVAEEPWAAANLPEGAFATVQDLIKDGRRVVLTPLVRNEPVVRSKVTEPGQRGSLSTMIEAGKRAVTLAVDDVRGVAGFIFPGDFVDVILTRSNNGSDSAQNFSEVILQHVKVLAVDQVAGERQEHPTIAKAVTVELGPEQALKALLATNIGRLSLILRQAAESESGPGARVTERDLAPGGADAEPLRVATVPPVPIVIPAAPVVEAPVAPPPPAPAIVKEEPKSGLTTVTIVRGAKPEDYSVVHGLW